jgi:hypothetical protein
MSAKRVYGPDVLVIGWIPYFETPPEVSGYPRGASTKLLFNSGNPNPSESFGGYDAFASWLSPLTPHGTKEYRAAVYIRNVSAEFQPFAEPVVRHTENAFIGYTPIRLIAGGANILAEVPNLPRYASGVGPVRSSQVTSNGSGTAVEIRYYVEFKLSRMMNLLSRVTTGSWAPYAWCEIVYSMDSDGNVDVTVDGSAVPSQRLYVDWAKPAAKPVIGIVPEYDMLTASAADVAGFIKTAGWGCRPAGGAQRLTWHT